MFLSLKRRKVLVYLQQGNKMPCSTKRGSRRIRIPISEEQRRDLSDFKTKEQLKRNAKKVRRDLSRKTKVE